jgi:hypothetical protein
MIAHVDELRRLHPSIRQHLFSKLCDEARRTDVIALGKKLFDKWTEFAMRDYDWCVQERKALEPELRVFLDGAAPAPKLSHKAH